VDFLKDNKGNYTGTFTFGEGINDELQALLTGKEQEYIEWLKENEY
jgi:hypothetical protein